MSLFILIPQNQTHLAFLLRKDSPSQAHFCSRNPFDKFTHPSRSLNSTSQQFWLIASLVYSNWLHFDLFWLAVPLAYSDWLSLWHIHCSSRELSSKAKPSIISVSPRWEEWRNGSSCEPREPWAHWALLVASLWKWCRTELNMETTKWDTARKIENLHGSTGAWECPAGTVSNHSPQEGQPGLPKICK